MDKFEFMKENTLKMIRNNQRLEDMTEELILYAKEKEDLELAEIIQKYIYSLENYTLAR